MRSILSILILLLISVLIKGQDITISGKKSEFQAFSNNATLKKINPGNALSTFAFSFNPLGLIQFGPSFNAELKIKKNLIMNARVRFPALGELSYVIQARTDGLNEFSGIAWGGGFIRFYGNNMNKPYMGFIIQYHTTKSLYAENEEWEWSRYDNAMIFFINGGYRFRFAKGYFINAGALFGMAMDKYNWEYTVPAYGLHDERNRKGTLYSPFGMLELSIGIEFKPAIRKIFKPSKSTSNNKP